MKIVYIAFSLIFPVMASAVLPEIQFSHPAKYYREGQTAIVTAELNAPTNVAVSVIAVPLYDISGSDENDHNIGPAAEIVIAPGQTKGSFSFQLLEDGIEESGETITLLMTAPQNAKLTANKTMQIIVNEQSSEDLPVVEFLSANGGIAEGGTYEVKATLSSPATSIVKVPFGVSGTATPNEDHNLSMRDELIFYPGMTEATIAVKAFTDENWGEEQETIIIRMNGPVVNARMGNLIETTVGISNVLLVKELSSLK